MSNYSSNKCLFSFSSTSSSFRSYGLVHIPFFSAPSFNLSSPNVFFNLIQFPTVSVDFPSMFLHVSPDFHVLSLEISGPPAAHGLPTPLLPAPHGRPADTEARAARAAAVGRRGETTGSHERSVPWSTAPGNFMGMEWEYKVK